jgi:O-antigen ligase
MRQSKSDIILPAIAALCITPVCLYLLTTPSPELAVFPGLMLGLLILLFIHPVWGYGAIVFLIPFGAYRQIGAFQGLRIHWLLALVLVVSILLKHLPGKELPPPSIRTSWWRPVAALLFVNLLASLFSPYSATAFKELSLLLAGFVFVAVNMYFVDRRVLCTSLPQVIVWSNIIGAGLASLGYFFNISLFAEKVYEGGFKRGIGTSTDPNNLALMILFTLPFLATWLLRNDRLITRITAAAGIFVCLTGLITTFSRSGGVLLALTILLILHQHRRIFRPKTIGLIIINGLLVLILLSVLVPEQYWKRQASLFGGGDFSLDRRLSYLFVARDAFLEKPLIGWGTGTFMHIYEQSDEVRAFFREGYTNRRKAHNTYLEFLIGSGIIGLGLFILMITAALRNFNQAIHAFQLAGETKPAIQTATFRTAFLSLLLFLLLFSDIYHKYLLLSLGVSCAVLRLSSQSSEGIPG